VKLPQLIDLVAQRLDRKTKTAEDGFVRSNTCKCTNNCKFAGRHLGDGIRACKAQAIGENEQEASLCHDRKSVLCSMFVPRLTPEQLRAKFRQMSDEELAVRYPSIGTLMWVLKQAQGVPDPNPCEE
jgi:hypothetical protein